jgi:formylglycine-generating enzyme required for sulfatase activity
LKTSEKTIWIIIGVVTVTAALAIITLTVVNKARQSAQMQATPTMSVEQALEEITLKMTAEAAAFESAYATQTAQAPTATPIPTTTPEPSEGEVRVSPVDGMEMIYIPKGPFWMGARDDDEKAQLQEKPLHEVFIEGFWMDRTMVTNGMYLRCIESGKCTPPAYSNDPDTYFGKKEYLNYPVVYINWDQAKVYCHTVNRRLPTEAEWEKAARGIDGRLYPWGNNPPDGELANFNNAYIDVQPTGRYLKGASPYGVLDMAGNAREWINDWYSEYYYGESASIEVPVNPTGPVEGKEKVLRGGAFNDAEIYLRTTSRLKHVPNSPGNNRGFRCAFSDESPY